MVSASTASVWSNSFLVPPIDAFMFAPVIFLLAPAEASTSSSVSPSEDAAVSAEILVSGNVVCPPLVQQRVAPGDGPVPEVALADLEGVPAAGAFGVLLRLLVGHGHQRIV